MMDCDSCGRYRPSSEISPQRGPDGRLVMACARCRRLVGGRRGDRPPEDAAPAPARTAATLATPR